MNKINQYSPLALAFLGDSVYEVLVREHILQVANMPVAKLHKIKINRVCAEYQSRALEKVMPMLNEEEISFVKHSNTADYRRATALECLFGYLHLSGQTERISQLFEIIWNMEEVIIP